MRVMSDTGSDDVQVGGNSVSLAMRGFHWVQDDWK